MTKKILTIDDEVFIRDLVQDFLELEGFFCKTAANLKEALLLLKKENYDLILLDRNLEDERAEDVIQNLRSINNEISIIIMTGDMDVPDNIISEFNISAIINKPFQYDAFIEVIKKNL